MDMLSFIEGDTAMCFLVSTVSLGGAEIKYHI